MIHSSKYIYDIAHFRRIAFTGRQTLKKQEAKYSKTRYVWSSLLFQLHFRVFLTNSNKKLSYFDNGFFFLRTKRRKKVVLFVFVVHECLFWMIESLLWCQVKVPINHIWPPKKTSPPKNSRKKVFVASSCQFQIENTADFLFIV